MSAKRKRVLLADDDLEMRQLCREVLEAMAIEVHEVSSGVALVSCLADDQDFDLIVTDVQMPWMSGEQVVQRARAAGFAVPVLIMTAFADDALRRSVEGISGARLLEKPFAMDELVAHTQRMLGIDPAADVS